MFEIWKTTKIRRSVSYSGRARALQLHVQLWRNMSRNSQAYSPYVDNPTDLAHELQRRQRDHRGFLTSQPCGVRL